MNKLVIGVVTTAALLAATPAFAQIGFYAGPGGVGVQVAPSYGYYEGPYRYNRAEPRYRVEPRSYRSDRYRRDGWSDYGSDNRRYNSGPNWERW